MVKTFLRRRGRSLHSAVTLIVAICVMASAHRTANGEAVAWDNSAGTFDQRWVYQFNWNPDIVPTSTSDVTLTAITPNLRIDAEGQEIDPEENGGKTFHDPALTANSLTISTHNPFVAVARMSGNLSNDAASRESRASSYDLVAGDQEQRKCT